MSLLALTPAPPAFPPRPARRLRAPHSPATPHVEEYHVSRASISCVPVCHLLAMQRQKPLADNGYQVMQSQMIGMQNSLDRILATLQQQTASVSSTSPASTGGPPAPEPPLHTTGPSTSSGRRQFPALPGFAPPPHKYATYGIVPSTAPSSDDESEDTLPRSTINAPIEALQGLANAAVEAATTTATSSHPRVKRRKRVEPIPPNPFPHVVEKGLVGDAEARELYHIFFSGCHLFIPLFDPSYDTYEALKERTPFCFDAILAVASKVKAGNGPPSPTFYKCLEEAQGIARSTLFGPIVRKEAVQGTLFHLSMSDLACSRDLSHGGSRRVEPVRLASQRTRHAHGTRSRSPSCPGEAGRHDTSPSVRGGGA